MADDRLRAAAAMARERKEELDSHEMMKAVMFHSRDPACDVHFDKSRPCPGDTYGVADSYVELDSLAKSGDGSDFAQGRIRFNFAVSGGTRADAVGTRDEIPTATEIIVEPFTIGLPVALYSAASTDATAAVAGITGSLGAESDPGGTVLAHGFSQVPFGERVTLQFEEFGRQARIGRDPHGDSARAHHVEFDAALGAKSDRLVLTPLSGERGLFTFVEPIRDVHTLTVRFRGVDRPLILPADAFKATPSVDTGDLLFAWSALSIGSATAMPALTAADRIYIRDFGSDAGDAFNSYVNRADGHLVADVTAGTSFRLNPNFTGLTLTPTAGSLVTVTVAKNRVRVNLRVRSIVGRLTNYISP